MVALHTMRQVFYAVIFSLTFGSNILQGLGAGDDMYGATINSPKYHAQVLQSKLSGKCEQTTTIKGRGVDDTYSGECLSDPLSFIATEEVLVIGDPAKDSYVLYSNTPANLKIIAEEECNRIGYFIGGMYGQIFAKEFVMTIKECDTARTDIEYQLKHNINIQWLSLKPDEFVPEHTGNNVAPIPWESNTMGLSHWAGKRNLFTIRAASFDEDGICKQALIFQGMGISDRFVGVCDDHNGPSIYVKKMSPIAVVKSDLLTLLHDEPSTLYTILDGKNCKKKTYYNLRFGIGSSSEDVSPNICREVKARAEAYVNRANVFVTEWDVINPLS